MMHALIALLLALQQDNPIVLNGDHVWGRQYRPRGETPVMITVDNNGPTVEARIVLRWGLAEMHQTRKDLTPQSLDGAWGPTYEFPTTLPEKSRRRYFANVAVQEGDSHQLWVFVLSGHKTLRSFAVMGLPFKGEAPIVGIVGGGLLRGLSRAGTNLAPCRPDEMPDRWYGFSTLTALVWLDADAGMVRDPATIEALRQWVAGGGHLVIARSNTVGLTGTFLEQFAPVTIAGSTTNADWSPLQKFAGSSKEPEGEEAMLQVRPRNGTILAGASNRPLIVRAPLGRGRVTFLAFDAGPLLDKWEGAERFWTQLLELPPPPPERRDRDSRYQGELARALGSRELQYMLGVHPQLPLPSLGWAFLMIVIYVILVGPVDYVVLRWLKKMELTWVTFPTCVIVFSAFALVAGASMTSYPPTSRETLVVDVYSDAGVTRGWSISSILTPAEQKIAAFTKKPHATIAPHFTLSYGDSSGGRITEGRVDDWYFPRGATGVAILKWSEKSAAVRVEKDATGVKVTNDSGSRIRDAVLLRGGSAYQLGDVPTGVSTHALDRKVGNWKTGMSLLGADRGHGDSSEMEDWQLQQRHRFSDQDISDAQLRARMRSRIAALSFARATAPTDARHEGLAAEIDLTSWAEQGHTVLLGFTEMRGTLEFDGVKPQQTTDTLLRVFTRDD